MPRQRTNYRRSTYGFPDDFPQRLVRFQEESGLSWSSAARPPPTLAASRPTRAHTNGHGRLTDAHHPRGAHSLCRGSHTQTGMDRLTAAHPTLGALTRCVADHARTHKGHGQADKLPTTLGAPPNRRRRTLPGAPRAGDRNPRRLPCRNVGTVTRIPSWRSGTQGRPTPSGPHPHPYQSGIAPEPPIGSA